MNLDVKVLDFKPLQKLIEEEQNIKTKPLKFDGNRITIRPNTNIYRENIADEKFLKIVFRINNDEIVLAWVYLLLQKRGTGTKIVQWFINYCKDNNYKKFKVNNVKNIYMEKFVKNLILY